MAEAGPGFVEGVGRQVLGVDVLLSAFFPRCSSATTSRMSSHSDSARVGWPVRRPYAFTSMTKPGGVRSAQSSASRGVGGQ